MIVVPQQATHPQLVLLIATTIVYRCAPIRFQPQPDYPTTPMLSLCPRPRCALTELHLTRAGSGSSPALAPLSKARAIARAQISWANGILIFSFSDG